MKKKHSSSRNIIDITGCPNVAQGGSSWRQRERKEAEEDENKILDRV